jgi:hypothetical protein
MEELPNLAAAPGLDLFRPHIGQQPQILGVMDL